MHDIFNAHQQKDLLKSLENPFVPRRVVVATFGLALRQMLAQDHDEALRIKTI